MKKRKAYLLDTDIVIYWLKNKYPEINKKIKCFGEIKSLLKSQGKIICDSDLFIAAVAIYNDLILVTNN